MKLVKLTITPEGNQAGECAEIAIDTAPSEFKSRYFSMVKSMDGEFHVTSKPAQTSEETINLTEHTPMCIRTVDDGSDVYMLVYADKPFTQEEADTFAKADGIELLEDDDEL